MGDVTTVPEKLYALIRHQRAAHPDRPVLIGVAGSQGSGKTTACRLLAAANAPRFAHFSLDDVYLPRAARERLAHEVHPLFATRGPPGTHDIALAQATIDALMNADADQRTPLPVFDKATDDRAPESAWPVFTGRPEAILFDGWCVGALRTADGPPINALEAEEDAAGRWRDTINAHLGDDYATFFAAFDAIAYLRPPSFEVVHGWRRQQEEELLGRVLNAEEDAKLARFIQHYERITRGMIDGRHSAELVIQLDAQRQFVA
jgi:D-glycerate 3-kinase